MRIVCFKHVPFEGPAVIAEWALNREHYIETVDVFADTSLPQPHEYDMILVMGGAMDIYQDQEHPWLVDEKQAISDDREAGKYALRVCLEAQLIADVLGSPASHGKEVEIPWLPIIRSEFCPEWFPMPEEIGLYHWHGDTFAITPESTLVASSTACSNQIFLKDRQVLGLQCHLETTRESMNALIEACSDEIVDSRYIQSAETMLAEPDSIHEAAHMAFFKMLDHLTADV